MKACAAVLCVLLTASCGFPKDPEGTLERVRGGTLRVGITTNDPWTIVEEDEHSGVEVELVEGFAREIDSEVEWTEGSESELIAALHQRELDLVVAGLASNGSWTAEVTPTHPYLTTQVVVGFPDSIEGEDIAGLEVAVEPGTEAAGLLEKTDADPVRLADFGSWEGPIATDDWLLDDLGLEDRGVQLLETDHVFAAATGENAFLTRLERYLLAHEAEAERLLEEHGRP
jgi:polar amino acid transport system substrate-binding protein